MRCAESLSPRCEGQSNTMLTIEPREPEGVPKKHMLGGVCRRYNGLEHHQSSVIGNFFISL